MCLRLPVIFTFSHGESFLLDTITTSIHELPTCITGKVKIDLIVFLKHLRFCYKPSLKLCTVTSVVGYTTFFAIFRHIFMDSLMGDVG